MEGTPHIMPMPGDQVNLHSPPKHLKTSDSLTTSSLDIVIESSHLPVLRQENQVLSPEPRIRGSRRRVRGISGLTGSSAGCWQLCPDPGSCWNRLEQQQGAECLSLSQEAAATPLCCSPQENHSEPVARFDNCRLVQEKHWKYLQMTHKPQVQNKSSVHLIALKIK